MIENNRGILTAYCDGCGDENYESHSGQDFMDFVTELLSLGWTKRKVLGEWENYCPACSEPAADFPSDDEKRP